MCRAGAQDRERYPGEGGMEGCSPGWGQHRELCGVGTAWGPSAGLVQVQNPQMGCQEALQVKAKGTLADAWAGRKL